ncbi:hypothetical protein [Actinoplanes solisilvae]|uniref:hypothetical protein n=1 Tax=Actinoplanes solisilvae TaxID=2486853 RepID=UPI000FD764E9|nr:hypothetical protein [Actinoplanes solisilvae]
MAHDRSSTPPRLRSWAEVDPGRYPFNPTAVPVLIQTVTPVAGRSDLSAWTEAVSVVLSDRYGPWAYRWYWAPEVWQQGWNWITSFPAPAEAPALAVDALLTWRRWLMRIAERFDEYLPLLDPNAEPGDLTAAWESAIAELMRLAVAPMSDDGSCRGQCRRILEWFLTAAGVPEETAASLVNSAVDVRLDWRTPTAAEVVDVAERLTRDVLELDGIASTVVTDTWPDTWPQNWPVWRAMNTASRENM